MARYRFCSIYPAAGRLWKTLDFHSERAMLIGVDKAPGKLMRTII